MTILFVTVGSTYFDDLIHCVLQPSFLTTCRQLPVTRLIVQYGKGTLPVGFPAEGMICKDGLDIDIHKFISGFDEVVKSVDMVISHAGSGSILSALRANKPLIVVPNTTLMDNHQIELADALVKDGYLAVSTVDDLANTLLTMKNRTLTPFPSFDPSKFSTLMDETMGFQTH